jgi:hypothetical protein
VHREVDDCDASFHRGGTVALRSLAAASGSGVVPDAINELTSTNLAFVNGNTVMTFVRPLRPTDPSKMVRDTMPARLWLVGPVRSFGDLFYAGDSG